MSKPSLLTIVNRNARGYDEREVRYLMGAHDVIEGKLIITEDLEHLDKVLRDSDRPDILGIFGGDGSAGHTLGRAKDIWGEIPDKVIPLAGGTMNDWAIVAGAHDPFLDRLKRKTRIGNSKPVQVIDYVVEQILGEEELHTEDLGILRCNSGRRGFIYGSGMVPKLVWAYKGGSIFEFLKLEGAVNLVDSQEHFEKVYEDHLGRAIELNGARGTINAFKETVGRLLVSPRDTSGFYGEKLDGEIYADGKRVELDGKANAIYASTIPIGNLGIGIDILTPTVLPGAREHPGKMQVVIATGHPACLTPQIFSHYFLLGREVPFGTTYLHCETLEYRASENDFGEKVAFIEQVDSEIAMSKGTTISYDDTLHLVTPFDESYFVDNLVRQRKDEQRRRKLLE